MASSSVTDPAQPEGKALAAAAAPALEAVADAMAGLARTTGPLGIAIRGFIYAGTSLMQAALGKPPPKPKS